LVINASGSNVGLWKDFATGDGGNNLVELLYRKNGDDDFAAAVRQAEQWLADGGGSASAESSVAGGEKKKFFPNKIVDCKDLEKGSPKDLRALARLLGIGEEGIEKAAQDGVLCFFDHPANGRCWSVLDVKYEFSDCNLCASGNAFRLAPTRVRQDRRLDGKPFLFTDGSTAKSRTVGSPAYPVARFSLMNYVVLCEGSSDFLAAYHLAIILGMSNMLSIVAIMGAGIRICEERLKEFSRRKILAFPDYDHPGISGMERWEKQLAGIARSFSVFDYDGLHRDGGLPIKDLRDFVHIDVDDWERSAEVRNPLNNLLSQKDMEVAHV
jgi:hypothetical protein